MESPSSFAVVVICLAAAIVLVFYIFRNQIARLDKAMIAAIANRKLETSLGQGASYDASRIEPLLKSISQMDIVSKERIVESCFGRPVRLFKVNADQRSWIIGAWIYVPEEETLDPEYLKDLMRKSTG